MPTLALEIEQVAGLGRERARVYLPHASHVNDSGAFGFLLKDPHYIPQASYGPGEASTVWRTGQEERQPSRLLPQRQNGPRAESAARGRLSSWVRNTRTRSDTRAPP